MKKIVIIGGGSLNWSFGFVRQFADSNRASDFRISLVDIDADMLELVYSAEKKYIAESKSGLILEKEDNLESGLAGADFILITISTGGLNTMKHDLEIPEKYGIRHTVENHSWYVGNRDDDKLPFSLKRTYIAERQKIYDDKRRKHEAYLKGELPADHLAGGHGKDPVPAVVDALSGGKEFYWASNYGNIGQIEGLPSGAVVETRCRFDSAGVHPFTSPMPDIIKTMTLPIVLRQEMILDVALNGTFDELVAIMASDPLCAHLSPLQIQKMTRELEANGEYITNGELKTEERSVIRAR